MRTYITRRVLPGLLVLWLVSLVIFSLVRILPGDAVIMQLDQAAAPTPEALTRARQELGLERPFLAQYRTWMANAVQGDLGRALITRRPVAQELLKRINLTTHLAVLSVIVALLIALPIGVLSASVFLKEVKDFIFSSSNLIVPRGPNNGYDGLYQGYRLSTSLNGGSARYRGIEFSYQQQFTFLPGIWKGLGAFANVTRMQSEVNYGSGVAIALAPNPRVAGFNPFLANVGISYIRSKISLRASYNYRARYLSGFNANESRSTYAHARPTVDIKTTSIGTSSGFTEL